jgi:hypothetical protein
MALVCDARIYKGTISHEEILMQRRCYSRNSYVATGFGI